MASNSGRFLARVLAHGVGLIQSTFATSSSMVDSVSSDAAVLPANIPGDSAGSQAVGLKESLEKPHWATMRLSDIADLLEVDSRTSGHLLRPHKLIPRRRGRRARRRAGP